MLHDFIPRIFGDTYVFAAQPSRGAGGHPACRQARESDRLAAGRVRPIRHGTDSSDRRIGGQDAYLPHGQVGCAPSSGALFDKFT
jgi:hypothetical protein